MNPSKQNASFRLKFFHLIFWGLLAASAWGAGTSEEKVVKPSAQDAATVQHLKSTIAKLNQQLSRESSNMRLFAQLADKAKTEKEGHLIPSSKVVRVANAKSWPELTVTSFIVLLRDDGSVAAFHEVPVSESGDWDNGYTHYFDQAGNTIALVRTSSFFNACPDATDTPDSDTSFLETSTYYYRDNKLVAKDYSFVVRDGEKEKAISPAKCEFSYRHPYTIHPNWPAAMKAAGLAQAWQGKP